MPLYGYARVSTLDQDLTIQQAALKAAGCDVIRAEKASGTRRDGRSELQVLLDFVHAGDTLVVTRIDRLARSLKDLQDIVHELKAKGVALKATEQPVDTGTAAGKAFLDMLGVFAEFETNLRRERQLEGISAAKVRGVYKGRKPSIDVGEVHRLRHDEKLGPAAIARRLGIGRASVYRVLGKQANGGADADQG
jgi:DNA invertase Pin-like site-specific DNA recombinase